MYVKANAQFLSFLVTTVPTQAKHLLKALTRDQYSALREIAHNLLRGTLQLTQTQIKTLRAHRTFYRQLAGGQKPRLLLKPIILMIRAAEPTLKKVC